MNLLDLEPKHCFIECVPCKSHRTAPDRSGSTYYSYGSQYFNIIIHTYLYKSKLYKVIRLYYIIVNDLKPKHREFGRYQTILKLSRVEEQYCSDKQSTMAVPVTHLPITIYNNNYVF